jgi:hypothetical protein
MEETINQNASKKNAAVRAADGLPDTIDNRGIDQNRVN